MEKDVKLLDELIILIKSTDKVDAKPGYLKFEFYFILSLTIARYELLATEKLSNITCGALAQLFVFQVFEYYYEDWPSIYSKSTIVFDELTKYNDLLTDSDIGLLGVKDTNWIEYFHESISFIIYAKKPNW